MRDPNYTDKEKVFLYIISDHYQYCLNTDRKCKLSYSLIREWTGWGYGYVSKTIKSLVSRGDITAETEQLGGKMKSTTEFTSGYILSGQNVQTGQNVQMEQNAPVEEEQNAPAEEGYYQGGSSTTTKVVAGGTTKVVGINKTKKQ